MGDDGFLALVNNLDVSFYLLECGLETNRDRNTFFSSHAKHFPLYGYIHV